MVVSQASWDVGSLPMSVFSSARVGYSLGSLSVALSSEASKTLRHMRGSMHLWNSHTTLHSTPEGNPDFSTQPCRGMARPIVPLSRSP